MVRTMMVGWLATGCIFGPDGSATSEIPCSGETQWVEVWRASGKDGGLLSVTVDTVDATTTFDPFVFVLTAAEWGDTGAETQWSEIVGGSDDDFPCSFPPPQYECPSAVVQVAGDVGLLVASASDNCVGDVAEYRIDVTLDGDPVRLRNLGLVNGDDLSVYY